MLALFFRFLRIQSKSLVWYLLFAIGLIWVYVAIFPSFADQAEQFELLVKSYPEGFLKAFGIEDGIVFSNIDNFIATEHYSLMWPILVIVLGISYASSALAGEIESGAIDTLLAQPISRAKVYWVKWLVGTKLIGVFTLLSIWSVVPLAAIYNVEINELHHLKLTIAAFAFGMSVYSLAFAFSALSSTRGRVTGVIGGIVVAMYAIDLIAKLKESFADANYISLFRYFEFANTLVKGNLEIPPLLVLGGVSIVASLVGYVIFTKRDISA